MKIENKWIPMCQLVYTGVSFLPENKTLCYLLQGPLNLIIQVLNIQKAQPNEQGYPYGRRCLYSA